jgi:peptide/nickel transport system ATP-binding protein
LGTIPGIVPSLVGDVQGCVFRTRCPHAVAECRGDIPKHVDGTHAFRCVFPDGKRHSEKELTI